MPRLERACKDCCPAYVGLGQIDLFGNAVAGAAVDRVDRLGVLLLDDVALDLQRRGELAGWRESSGRISKRLICSTRA